MSEATQEQPQSQEPEVSTEPSLEDVYKQYSVAEAQQPETPQRQEQQRTTEQQEVHVPDAALDPEGYKQWARQRLHSEEQIKQALLSVAGELNQFKAAQTRQREEADIKRAVNTVLEKLPDLDPDYAEIAIAAQARKDPKFMSLWQNREKNPQAWNSGLKALSGQIAKKMSMVQDPQITENLRAAKQSQQSSATASPEDDELTRMGKMPPDELDRYLNKYRGVA